MVRQVQFRRELAVADGTTTRGIGAIADIGVRGIGCLLLTVRRAEKDALTFSERPEWIGPGPANLTGSRDGVWISIGRHDNLVCILRILKLGQTDLLDIWEAEGYPGAFARL